MTPTVAELRALAERCLTEGPLVTIETPDVAVANFVTQSPRHLLRLLDALEAAETDRAELIAMLDQGLQLVDDSRVAVCEELRARAVAAEARVAELEAKTETRLGDEHCAQCGELLTTRTLPWCGREVCR